MENREEVKRQTILEYLQEIGIDVGKTIYIGEEKDYGKGRNQGKA